ncbi:Serine/threonine-protein kinase SCH9 [Penicillium sp. IBT 35674x]|nr:Serine/threonine-protein kinase SCH9 [Penicillium sp. IBT 35674x]
MQAHFKGFTFAKESAICRLAKDPGNGMEEGLVDDESCQRTCQSQNSADQRMGWFQKADGSEPAIFGVDDNFDV